MSRFAQRNPGLRRAEKTKLFLLRQISDSGYSTDSQLFPVFDATYTGTQIRLGLMNEPPSALSGKNV